MPNNLSQKDNECFFCEFIKKYPELARKMNFENINNEEGFPA